jgi:peptide-methionine (R)-S-oxide reductase
MTKSARFTLALLLFTGVTAAHAAAPAPKPVGTITHTDAEWKALLPSMSYQVLRHSATELAFTGKLLNEHRTGTFTCAGCGLELFASKTKFDSGTGWPSFWQPLDPAHVRLVPVSGYSGDFFEVRCARCDGHLGHVFDDGPPPTGKRFCMNSAALAFRPAK